ncbi:uncharacterized protein L201_006113 [Kwoniella dendrophila CBS 6074]|uniref:Uncharacterized protein n=1 Tax=Kwoniella dendrophila CBS 6074 TaxID=1295534 RepID=A0AAX4K0T7_9TREE
MIRPRTILISITSITTLGWSVFYYHHHRLLTLYPTLPIPQYLSLTGRNDKPYTTDKWAKCDAGDSWAIKVPKSVMMGNSDDTTMTTTTTTESSDNDLGIRWNKSFWGSSPLSIEGTLFGFIKGFLGYKTDEGSSSKEMSLEKGDFEIGKTVLNGLFTIESINYIPISSITNQGQNIRSSQITYRWGDLTPAVKSSILVRGGYHTLSILPLNSISREVLKQDKDEGENENDQNDYLYLIFTAQGVYKYPLSSSSSLTSSSIQQQPKRSIEMVKGMNILDKIFAEFHREYSRILFDLAIKRMGLYGKFEIVNQW